MNAPFPSSCSSNLRSVFNLCLILFYTIVISYIHVCIFLFVNCLGDLVYRHKGIHGSSFALRLHNGLIIIFFECI